MSRNLSKYFYFKLINFLKNPVTETKLNFYKLQISRANIQPEKYTKLRFKILTLSKSDINEHLFTLFENAKLSETIFETGVRGVISSWAFLYGLFMNNKKTKKLFLNDINECDIEEISKYAEMLGIDIEYSWGNNLDIEISQRYDLIFIDTWHVYAQLKRELEKFAPICNKTIILHDTTIDAELGESIRHNWDIERQSKESGFTIEEIRKGLWPAVEEFLHENKEWFLKKRYLNNNGLTILERK